MRQVSVREMQQILKDNGYRLVRTKGSHGTYSNGENIVTIPLVTLKAVVANRLIKEIRSNAVQ